MTELKIHEVGMRDGLQVEPHTVPLEQKIKWIQGLMESGIDMIQLGSFVNPQKVPQMADTDKLFTHFTQQGQKTRPVTLTGLVLNEKGLERGLACGVEQFCMGISASDTHSRKNTGMGTVEATERIIAMAKMAQAAGKKVQVSVQSAFGCGFEGVVPKERVLSLVGRFLEAELKIISLADTAGHANPGQVEELFRSVLAFDSSIECACHFHNTYGLGLANCYAALKAGVKYFEAAFAGLGGCPFTAVTGGNVSTEDLVHLLHRMSIRSDIAIDRIMAISREASSFFNRELPSTILKTGVIPQISKGK